MRVEIRAGGEGVTCWNEQAIETYADGVNQNEERLRQRNPDLVVIPGRVKCYGCEVQEYHYAMKCTAELTKTLFAVEGEVKPRPADAAGLHREIPGLETTLPDDKAGAASASSVVPDREATPANNYIPPSAPQSTSRSGLRGLLRRGG